MKMWGEFSSNWRNLGELSFKSNKKVIIFCRLCFRCELDIYFYRVILKLVWSLFKCWMHG